RNETMTAESQHTPGPWTLHEDGDANHYSIIADGKWLISFLHNGEKWDAEQSANAKLIAAAPMLLEACKAGLAALERADLDGEILWLEPPYQAPAVCETAHGRLIAVIEEATGEN